ncbi:hypothetical protein HK096_002397 [Nowakowskiella sp. JEL0078]|nr:hypothetical protein HK096_002397 [Nowakowskiella sp. JEL0078]
MTSPEQLYPPCELSLLSISFLCKTPNTSWQTWKETEPELYWFFERQFKAISFSLRLSGEEGAYLVEVVAPGDQALRIEKIVKDGILATELDKIHGIDPLLFPKRDAKITRFQTTIAPLAPTNNQLRVNVADLESQLQNLELQERARSIDLRVLMETFLKFQQDMMKKIDSLEKKVEEGVTKLDAKCDRLEKPQIVKVVNMAGGNPFEPYHIAGFVVPRYRLALIYFGLFGAGIAGLILKPSKPVPITFESKAEESFVKKYIDHHHHEEHKPSILRTTYKGN